MTTHVVVIVWSPSLTVPFVSQMVLRSSPLLFDELEGRYLTDTINDCALVPSCPELFDGVVCTKVARMPAGPKEGWLLHHLKDGAPAAVLSHELRELRYRRSDRVTEGLS